jgi:hypothetical protein
MPRVLGSVIYQKAWDALWFSLFWPRKLLFCSWIAYNCFHRLLSYLFPYSRTECDRRFRGVYCLYNEVSGCSKHLWNASQIQHNAPKDSRHIRYRENCFPLSPTPDVILQFPYMSQNWSLSSRFPCYIFNAFLVSPIRATFWAHASTPFRCCCSKSEISVSQHSNFPLLSLVRWNTVMSTLLLVACQLCTTKVKKLQYQTIIDIISFVVWKTEEMVTVFEPNNKFYLSKNLVFLPFAYEIHACTFLSTPGLLKCPNV